MSFQRISGENITTKDLRDYLSNYYVPNIEIKDFNVLTDGKSFFDLPVKNEEEKHYKLIVIDLSKQTKLKDPHHINFIAKLENQDNGATMFFIIKKLKKTTFNF